MNGYQYTFFAPGNRRHKGKPIGEWLVELAKELGLGGATLQSAVESFGHDKKIHSAHFFELADQPMKVLMAVTPEQSEKLLQRLIDEGVHLFYIKIPAEFGTIGHP